MENEQSTALQKPMQEQLKNLSEEERKLFDIYSNESGSVKMSIPKIKIISDNISADGDFNRLGGFMSLDYDQKDNMGNSIETKTYLGKQIELTIIRPRYRYSYYSEAENKEIYGTPEFDNTDKKGIVELWDTINKTIVFKGEYEKFKEYILTNFPRPKNPDSKFNTSYVKYSEVLYVEYNGKIYRMYLNLSSCKNFWEYKKEIVGVPVFLYKTILGTVTMQKGSNTYYPVTFTKSAENDIKKYVRLRAQVDADIKLFDVAREKAKVTDNSDRENFEQDLQPDTGEKLPVIDIGDAKIDPMDVEDINPLMLAKEPVNNEESNIPLPEEPPELPF